MYTIKQFQVRAWSDPATVSRVINPFVQLGLVPLRIEARVQESMMELIIVQDGLEELEAERLVSKLQGIWLVQVARHCDVIASELEPMA